MVIFSQRELRKTGLKKGRAYPTHAKVTIQLVQHCTAMSAIAEVFCLC